MENLNLKQVGLVARYERKLLVRNKLFWIFAILVLIGTVLMQWTRMQRMEFSSFHWFECALPSYMPFLNVFIFNLAQGLVVIFFGLDYVWRDRRLETNAVFSARPMSNTVYQAGKVCGIVEVFLLLNVLSVGAGMGIQLLFGDADVFQPVLYLVYMFLLAIPTLVFVLGVGLVLAHRLRNHALTILLFLAIFILFNFGTSDILWGTLDPWARTLPLLFSDVTGMARPGWVVLQRGAFMITGMGMILLAMGMMKRLDDPKSILRGVRSGGWLLVLLGISCGVLYYGRYREVNSRRQEYREVFQSYVKNDRLHVVTHDIAFRQEGERMFGESKLLVENTRAHRMERPLLYLNPGLQVVALRDGEGNPLPYHREAQVILLERGLAPGERLEVSLNYEGVIDEAVCYLDFPDEDFHHARLYNFAREPHPFYWHGGNYARVSDRYTFLIPECLWYPVSVPPVNVVSPMAKNYDFTRFSLQVDNERGMTVISQGEMSVDGSVIRYTNREPLPRLSLCIGDYEKQCVNVDSLQLEMYYFPGHDFFTRDFTMSEDSMKMIVKNSADEFRWMKSKYPFRKFAIVETPVNFVPFQRKGSNGSEFVLPEMIFLPERMYNAFYKRVGRWPEDEDERSRYELERDAFKSMFLVNFQGETYNFNPLFDEFGGIVASDDYPGVHAIVNHLLLTGFIPRGTKIYFGNELEYFEIVDYWTHHSVREAFLDREIDSKQMRDLLDKKFDQIVEHLRSLVNERDLFAFAEDFKRQHVFARTDFSVLEKAFDARFGLSIRKILDAYYQGNELPVLHVHDYKEEKYEEGEEEQIIVSGKIYNPSTVDGVITVQGTFTPGEVTSSSRRLFLNIPAGSCKEFRAVSTNPYMVSVSLGLCRNIPERNMLHPIAKKLVITKNGRLGIWDTDSSGFTRKEEGIVVDDKELIIHEKRGREKLAAYFSKDRKKKKYENVYEHTRWTPFLDMDCYGDIVKSAYYKMASNGASKVEWKVNIPRQGTYEVFAYVPDIRSSPARKAFIKGARLFYQVGSTEGITDVEVDLDNEIPGWLSLGKYKFNSGEYNVFLSDRGGDALTWDKTDKYAFENEAVQYIVADAVKWVPVDK